MPHLEKVLAHAEKQLVPPGIVAAGELAARLPQYKRFLKIENHRLRLAHQAGGGGREICRRRVGLLDVLLKQLFADACQACLRDGRGESAPATMLAIGGYGRGELNPHSDVDVLFLHDFPEDDVPEEANELIKQILYVLWDIGFKVGHATRSIAETCAHANLDNVSKTALLEARPLAGQGALFTKFQARFERECILGQEQSYLAWREADQTSRHLKYGPTVFLQEPNIKSSPGGLRDYHNLLWSAYFKERTSDTADLVEKQLLNESERRALEGAYDFLLHVRTDLQYLARRSADTLSLPYQGQIADRFLYPQKNELRRSEAFMRDYYQHARALSLITENIFQRIRQSGFNRAAAKPASGLMRLFNRNGPAPERFDGFLAEAGQIYPETRDVFNQDPIRLLRVFEHAQRRNLRLSSELQQLIRRRLRLVNRTFQYSRAAREVVHADPVPARQGRPHPARDARGRPARGLPAGVRRIDLSGPARVLPPLLRRRAHAGVHRETRRAGRERRPEVRRVQTAPRRSGGPVCPLSRPAAARHGKSHGRAPPRGGQCPCSRRRWLHGCNSPPNAGGGSFSWWTTI